MRQIAICQVLLTAMLVLGFIGCADGQEAKELYIRGFAHQHFNSGAGLGNSQTGIMVKFQVRNGGSSDFRFAALHARFETSFGHLDLISRDCSAAGCKPGNISTMIYEPESIRSIPPGANIRIPPMTVLSFQFWTTGRQEMLFLNRATNRFEPDAELRLNVFFCDEKIQPFISYVAVVPPFRKLPEDDEDVFEKIGQRPPETGKLTFRRLSREERQ